MPILEGAIREKCSPFGNLITPTGFFKWNSVVCTPTH